MPNTLERAGSGAANQVRQTLLAHYRGGVLQLTKLPYPNNAVWYTLDCPECGQAMSIRHGLAVRADGAPSIDEPLVCPFDCGWRVSLVDGVATDIPSIYRRRAA